MGHSPGELHFGRIGQGGVLGLALIVTLLVVNLPNHTDLLHQYHQVEERIEKEKDGRHSSVLDVTEDTGVGAALVNMHHPQTWNLNS